jgi:hypothetical protein
MPLCVNIANDDQEQNGQASVGPSPAVAAPKEPCKRLRKGRTAELGFEDGKLSGLAAAPALFHVSSPRG